MTSSRCSHPRLAKFKRQEETFCCYANDNHESTFVLPIQESVISTNYKSTVCETDHTLREALEYTLQNQTISPFIVGQLCTMTNLVPGLKCVMALNILGTFV
jgi:hypothetical protein